MAAPGSFKGSDQPGARPVRPTTRIWLGALTKCSCGMPNQIYLTLKKHLHKHLPISRPRKKCNFSMAKTVGSFSQNHDFFPEHTNRENWGNFTKSVIYRDQKSKKLPNDWHNERAVVRILIENGAEISENSALAWHCTPCTFLDGCFELTRLSL